jgi:hypothetical protein
MTKTTGGQEWSRVVAVAGVGSTALLREYAFTDRCITRESFFNGRGADQR